MVTHGPAEAAPVIAPDDARPGAPVLSPTGPFRTAFQRWARRVRASLALRQVVAAVTVALVVAAGAAAVAWRFRLGELRPWTVMLALVGVGIGGVIARRRRWSDVEVALYLDRKLRSKEAIVTAVELDREGEAAAEPPARAVVLDQAVAALGVATPRGPWPRVWRMWHVMAPVAVGMIVWLSLVALPPLPPPAPAPPGSEIVKLGEVAGLDKVIRLSELDPRDEAQRQRLRELSERARKLQDKLRQGMERREAQSDVAKLRDAVSAERVDIGAGEQRAGLEAALSKLGENADLKEARRALGDRDLTRFDQEMEKLANKLEAEDRERAKKALEEAARAARSRGAGDVAQALEEQKRLLDGRGQRADRLRELAKAFGDGLSEEAKEALRNFEQSGSGADQQKLAEALERALGELTDEERKRLAQRLEEQANQIDPETSTLSPMTKEQLEKLQKQLSTPEGQKELAEQLRQMAKEPGPESRESQRQKELGEAERGLGQTEKQLGGQSPVPMPLPVPGQGQCDGKQQGQGSGKQGQGSGKQGQGNGKQGQGNGNGARDDGKGGVSRGGGPGTHGGQTKAVDAEDVRARANARVNAAQPMPGMVLGRTAGKAGETANRVGTGELGTVGPDEVGAVERSEVPEEYRDQVGRYFQPQ